MGNAVTALSPDYPLVLASRVLAAAGAAMFTPNAGATAAAIAGAERRGRAIAVVTIGLTSSLAGAGPLAVSLNAAVMYLPISLSSVIGAIGLSWSGTAAALPRIAAGFLVAAALLVRLSSRSERQATIATTADRATGDTTVSPTTKN